MNMLLGEDTGAVVAISASLDGLIGLAGCEKGLWITRDGGQSWSEQSALLRGQLVTAVAVAPDPSATPTMVSGVPGGVLRTISAEQWQTAEIGRVQPQISGLAFSPHFARDSVVFASTGEDGVLRSADGGRSFHFWNFGLLDLHTLALALSPNYAQDETVYVGTASGLFRSRNGGRAWREWGEKEGLPADITVLSLVAQRGSLIIGSEAHGVWRSGAGMAGWQPIAGTLDLSPVNALTVYQSSVFVGGGNRVYRYDGSDDLELVMQDISAVLALASVGNSVFAGTAETGLWRLPGRRS